jgi:hypothetical protein
MQSTPSHRFSRASLVVTGLLVSSAWGCAHLPQTGAEVTGEPLGVEMRTETRIYTTQAKVGEVVHRDSSGRTVGTSEVFENRTGSYDVMRWQAFQGDSPIDDQDFFRIGRDTASAQEIAALRQSGMTMNKVGIGLLIGGGAAALGGIILGNVLASSSSSNSSSGLTWPYYVGYIAVVPISVGSILTWVGFARVKREHPIDDPARANAVAKRYNKSIGAAPAPVVQEDEEEEEEEDPLTRPRPKKKMKKKRPSE